MKNKKINFVSFFDENNFIQFKVLLNSIKSNYKNDEYNIYCGVSKQVLKKNKAFFVKENIKTKIVSEKKLLRNFFKNKMLDERISIYTMCRFEIFEIFKELNSIEKNNETILYLDTDTFVNNKINFDPFDRNENYAFTDSICNFKGENHGTLLKEFLDLFSSNSSIKEAVNNKIQTGNYFNAGVLLINNPRKIKSLIAEARNLKDINNTFDDQTLLNFHNKGEIIVINDYKYNDQSLLGFQEKSYILHFTTRVKPYTLDGARHFKVEENDNIPMIKQVLINNEEFLKTKTSEKFFKAVSNELSV